MWFLLFINLIISISYGVNRGAAFAPKAIAKSLMSGFFCLCNSALICMQHLAFKIEVVSLLQQRQEP